ncbi:MAG: hypothetical protein ACM3OC_02045, partial [Deltaproteobacteria bacterium]
MVVIFFAVFYQHPAFAFPLKKAIEKADSMKQEPAGVETLRRQATAEDLFAAALICLDRHNEKEAQEIFKQLGAMEDGR